ncbi:MAG: hypothetical protein QF384_20330, partial [Alphaproteobacteria bacterium]|nr:hypothetical protein [Alphaproteobacteria bacterium]
SPIPLYQPERMPRISTSYQPTSVPEVQLRKIAYIRQPVKHSQFVKFLHLDAMQRIATIVPARNRF